MTAPEIDGTEHFLYETAGLFGTIVYECRHCGERSPDPVYFESINCPPRLDPDPDDPYLQE